MSESAGNITELCRTEAVFDRPTRSILLRTGLTMGSGSWVSVHADEGEIRRRAELASLHATEQINKMAYGSFLDDLLQIALEHQGAKERLPFSLRELRLGVDVDSVQRKIQALCDRLQKTQAPPIVGLDKAISDALQAFGAESEQTIIDTHGCE